MAFSASANTLVRNYDLILSFDPALDQEAEGFDDAYLKYLETGDADALPRKGNQQPTIWKMEHIRGEPATQLLRRYQDEVPYLQEGSIPFDLYYRAARMGLVGWENLYTADGKEAQFPRKQVDARGVHLVPEETMDWLDSLTDSRLQIATSLGATAIQKLVAGPLS